MNSARNMTAEDRQCLEIFQKLCKGMSLFAGLVAEISENSDGGILQTNACGEASRTDVTAQTTITPVAPAPAETKAPTRVETAVNSSGQSITRTDVQRAMAAKIRELSSKGGSPDAVGELFPQFHGAGCVSDLTEADYPLFLEELAKLYPNTLYPCGC